MMSKSKTLARAEMKSKGLFLAITIALILVLSIFVVSALVQLDPIRAFVHDGKITLHGSVTGAFLNYLQHGPTGVNYDRYVLSIDSRGTSSFVLVHSMSDTIVRSIASTIERVDFARFASDFVSIYTHAIVDAIKMPIVVLFDFVTGDASAACTGGNCFWIGGTGNFSTNTHWSLTSGGVACVCTPGSTDTVTFDASSGSGTATQDNASFTSGTVTMTNSSVTVSGSSNTWNVGQSWADTNGHFSFATSTVVFTGVLGTSSVNTATGSTSVNNFYNLQSTGGTNITYGTSIGVANVVTVTTSGNLNAGAGPTLYINSSNATPLVWSTARIWINVYYNVAGAYTIATNGTYGGDLTFASSGTGTLGAALNDDGGNNAGVGNMTITGTAIVAKSTFAINLSSTSSANLTLSGGAITSTSGAVTANSVNVSSASSYVTFGSETWTISGTWTNASTSGSWAPGTATVVFKPSTSKTMTFAGANLGSTNEFNNVTFDSAASGSTSITFTMSTRALQWGGTLIAQQTGASSGTETLATANLALTGGAMTIANKSVLTANTSTVSVTNLTMTGGTSGTITITSGAWSVSGNWDTSGASSTFTQGTSSVAFTGATKTIKLTSSQTFATMSVTGTYSMSSQLSAGATTVSSGSLTTGTNNVTLTNTLTISGGFVAMTSGTITLTNVSVTVAAAYMTMGSTSVSVSGTWTNASTSASWNANTSTVTFTSATGATITPGSVTNEFYDVTLTSSAASAQVFTLATRSLTWSHTLTISDSSSTTQLSSASLGMTGGAIVVGNSGIVVASASIVSVTGVTMTGGSSGTMTMNTSTWTVTGNWDTSGAGSTLTINTSSVTLSGTGSVKLLAGQSFATLVVSGGGTRSASSNLVVTSMTVQDASLATTYDTSASNYSITTTNLTIATHGILTLHASAIVVSHNYTDTSSETWSAWTGSITFNGSSAQAIAGKTTHVFANMTLSGTGTKTFTTSFAVKNVTLNAASKWVISQDVTMTVTSGSTITIHGTIAWDGSSASHVVLTSTSAWTLSIPSSMTFNYVDAKNSHVNAPRSITSCQGVDDGGNQGWVFIDCRGVQQITTLTPILSAVLIAVLVIVIFVVIFMLFVSISGRATRGFDRSRREK